MIRPKQRRPTLETKLQYETERLGEGPGPSLYELSPSTPPADREAHPAEHSTPNSSAPSPAVLLLFFLFDLRLLDIADPAPTVDGLVADVGGLVALLDVVLLLLKLLHLAHL